MWNQILPGLRMKLFMTLLLGVAYPLLMTGLARVLFPSKAAGSLITGNGGVAGSELIGQSFSQPKYFHPRPSSAGNGYDATASGGSNLGPTSDKLIFGTTKVDDKKNEVVDFDGISLRIIHYCVENGIAYRSSLPLDHFKDGSGNLDDVKLIHALHDSKAPLRFQPIAPVPADAVTGSASGLDPDISPAFAQAQVNRVARTRGVSADPIERLVAQYTQSPELGFLGEPRVNVLKLN